MRTRAACFVSGCSSQSSCAWSGWRHFSWEARSRWIPCWALGIEGAVGFVPWIALGYLFYVAEQVLEQQLLAYKRTVAVLGAQTSGAIASVAVTIPCVLRFGAKGAAYACPIYYSVQCLIVALLIWRSGPRIVTTAR